MVILICIWAKSAFKTWVLVFIKWLNSSVIKFKRLSINNSKTWFGCWYESLFVYNVFLNLGIQKIIYPFWWYFDFKNLYLIDYNYQLTKTGFKTFILITNLFKKILNFILSFSIKFILSFLKHIQHFLQINIFKQIFADFLQNFTTD